MSELNQSLLEITNIVSKNYEELAVLTNILNRRVNEQKYLVEKVLHKLKGENEENIEFNPNIIQDADRRCLELLNEFPCQPDIVEQVQEQKIEATSFDNSNEMFCYDCNTSFKRGSGEFTRHCLITKCKPYLCDLCKKLFRKKSNLTSHRMTHSSEIFRCFCGAEFKCPKYLQNHQLRKHRVKAEHPAFDIAQILKDLNRLKEVSDQTIENGEVDSNDGENQAPFQSVETEIKEEEEDVDEPPRKRRRTSSSSSILLE